MQLITFFVIVICFTSYLCSANSDHGINKDENEVFLNEEGVVVFQKGEGGYYCHKIPYLFRTTSNSLIALAEGRGKGGRESCDDFAGTDLVYKRSVDGGRTWGDLLLLHSNSSDMETNIIGNAAIVQDLSNNRIWVPFCKNNEVVFTMYSNDDGLTWSEPVYQPQLILPNWKWVGLGPPGGLYLSTGRMLLPGYHTNNWKGDGCDSYGHTIISDDHGETWQIGNAEYGHPFLVNENQAVELANKSVLVNARTVSHNRVQIVSNDGGITFGSPYIVPVLSETLEGCEGSIVRDPKSNKLYFSDPYGRNKINIIRKNMTVFESSDEGASWTILKHIHSGSVSYSSLQLYSKINGDKGLELLYERSDNVTLVFEPQFIVYVKVF